MEVYYQYIPKKAIPLVNYLIEKYKINLKIVKQRQTKHGDFRTFANGRTQITVNSNLNPQQFLLTLVHEIAHQVTYKKFGRVQPHGKEWKTIFQHLMLPFLQPEVYSKEILPHLAEYLKNPKASTDSDVNLSLALKGGVAAKGKTFIFDLPYESVFEYKAKLYKRLHKRRTRYECLNLSNKRIYLFSEHAEVKPIEQYKLDE